MKKIVSFLLMLCIVIISYNPTQSYAAELSTEGYIFIGQSHTMETSSRPEWSSSTILNNAGRIVRYSPHGNPDDYTNWPSDSNIYFVSSVNNGMVPNSLFNDGKAPYSSVEFGFLENEAIVACTNIIQTNRNISHWNIIITQGTGPISMDMGGLHTESDHSNPAIGVESRKLFDKYSSDGFKSTGNKYVNLYNKYVAIFNTASIYYMEDALMYKNVYCHKCYNATYRYIQNELKDKFIPTWNIYERYYPHEFTVDQAHYKNTSAYFDVYSNAIKTIPVSEFATETPNNQLYRKCEDYRLGYNYWNMSTDCGEFLAYYITFRKVNENALKVMNNHIEALEPAGLYNYLYMSADGDSRYTYSKSAVGLKEKEWVTNKGNPYKSASNTMRTYLQSINELTGSSLTWSTNLNGSAELKKNIESKDLDMIYSILKSQKSQNKPYGGVLWLGNIGEKNYLGKENVSSWAAIIDVDLSSKRIKIVDPTQTVQGNLSKGSFNNTCDTWIDISSTTINGMPIGITGFQIINGGDVSTVNCKTPVKMAELPK